MKKKRIGSQAPSQSIILPYQKTHKDKAIEMYERTGRSSQEWQSLLVSHILAQNEEGLWTHTKFGYSVPRRNGKNEVVAIRELYGLIIGENILHTAHRTTTSHAGWERLLKILDEAKVPYQSLRATGRERIELENGGRIEFRTRSSKGGIGEGFDLLVIDEAQEYTEDQESALKYVVTDSRNPQTIFCGTPPTPLSSGTVFTKMRSNVLTGESVNTGWAEWSVDDESDVRDRDLWYRTNPSLGTIITERSIIDEIGSDTIDFNIQRLGLWIKYSLKSAISQVEWQELQVAKLPKLNGRLYVGVKYGHDGTNVAMSIAVRTSDGRIFIETIDCRSIRTGTAWIIAFLKKADIGQVVVDGANRQQMLSSDMKDAGLKVPVLPTVREVIVANAAFEQGIFSETLCHKGQTSLAEVIGACEKRAIGTNGGFGYKALREGAEIALLDSVALAYWACSESKERKKQTVNY